MVVKVYISGISGNKEVKKRQQRVLMILDSKNITYEVIDITEPGRESDKDFMQNSSKSNGATVSDPNPRSPLPPQIFNEEEYCGDYDQFDLANEIDTLEQFLKVELPPDNSVTEDKVNAVNGDAKLGDKGSKENSQDRDSTERVAGDAETVAENAVTKENETTEEAKIDETSDKKTEEEEESLDKREKTPDENENKKREKTPDETGDDKHEKTPEETDNPSTEVESTVVKEETTVVNSETAKENGSTGSRETSEEKETEAVKKDGSPSEALIQSEQAAATE